MLRYFEASRTREVVNETRLNGETLDHAPWQDVGPHPAVRRGSGGHSAGHRPVGASDHEDGGTRPRRREQPPGLPGLAPAGPGAGGGPAQPDDAAREDRPDGPDR